MRDLQSQLEDAHIVVCLGSGGVGKTTTAAAIGLVSAFAGRRTLVLTIDPSRRLADTLGLDAGSSKTQDVSFDSVHGSPLSMIPGEIKGMVLDTQATFDQLIHTYVADEDTRQRIFENRYYQNLSTTLAGSYAYMAMEKIYELHQTGDYDLIVIDTPPSDNVLDFIDAPEQIQQLMGNNALLKFMKSNFKKGFLGMKVLSSLTAPMQRFMGSILGSQVITDLHEFLSLDDERFRDGFVNRARAVKKLLFSHDTVYVSVANPMKNPMREALLMYNRIKEENMRFGGFVINRVHDRFPASVGDRFMADCPSALSKNLKNRLLENFRQFEQIGRSDRTAINQLTELVDPDSLIIEIPYFEGDVVKFQDLMKMCAFFAQGASKEQGGK
ncbi:MAG: ATPase [Deltaproteobacteria bacterium]|nr:MAG: ATPase [Deltaproteobacteria bacterium]